ncbi:OmpH family outer membrane protein [Massilia sp. PAMC28688]|uniref:OmpH family outer membrane protein n=1 Tax=Massilia sp. PAMC28688 TaxID=2861283 RepID=UPI001C637EBD|nr:OmpH family outer membrane protein [Massilia sp. PAMC28688]QYF92900.1 OmpH family outer membrane protein [Massilia sp. PAMC28688]
MLRTLTASLPKQLAVLTLLACASLAQAQPSRVGFVYTERLMTESKMAKTADAKIEAEFSKRQKAIQETISRFKAMSDKFDAEAAKLTEPERTKRARELIDLDKDVQRTQREFREDLIQRKSEERANISTRAYKLIEQIAEQERLDIVLQEAAWVSPRIDITDKVLKLLDK